jgi:hypothetical protein
MLGVAACFCPELRFAARIRPGPDSARRSGPGELIFREGDRHTWRDDDSSASWRSAATHGAYAGCAAFNGEGRLARLVGPSAMVAVPRAEDGG